MTLFSSTLKILCFNPLFLLVDAPVVKQAVIEEPILSESIAHEIGDKKLTEM